MARGTTVLMLSRVFAGLSIVTCLGLLLPLILDRPLAQALIVSAFLLINAFVSALVFPAIELRKPCLFVPQLFASVLTQLLALTLIMCAVMQLDGQETILSHYQPYNEWWNTVGANFYVGCLVLWTIIFLLGNFVLLVHCRTFSNIRRSLNESPSRVISLLPPPYSVFTLQADGRPVGSPPSYEDIEKAAIVP